MTRTSSFLLLLVAFCWAASPLAQPMEEAPPPDRGSVVGTITYDDRVPPPGRGPFRPIEMTAECAEMHSGPVTSGELVLGDGNTLGNVFVQILNPPEGDYEPPRRPVVIEQRGCVYAPRVVGVMQGQPLQFKNSDGILHNVHGLPKENREFNIGMPPTVTERSVTLNKPEPLFTVKCDVHPWMQSYVAVMTHPYFAVTDESGRFRLDNVPDGTYEIEAWHERLGTQTGTATVDGGRTRVDFSFRRP